MIRCPECNGASNAARDSKQSVAAMIAREHAITERIRTEHGLPPIGTTRVDLLADKPLEPPPDDFAKKGVPIPTTVSEEQRERARVRLAAAVSGMAGKMREPK